MNRRSYSSMSQHVIKCLLKIFKQFPFPSNFNKINLVWKIPLFIKTKNKELILLMNEQEIIIDIKKINFTKFTLRRENKFLSEYLTEKLRPIPNNIVW